MTAAQRPLELILARNLLTSLSTPAFLVDARGAMLFYNEAAGALMGISFEESGHLDPDQWTATFGPTDESGEPIPVDRLPYTIALREGRPAHSEFRIHSARGAQHEIASSAMPIVGNERRSLGAMIFFWPLDPDWNREGQSAGAAR
jgi:PAS domain-containing protein